MLWHQSKNKRWLSAFSSSFLAVFMLQLLVSAACISTAEAEVSFHVAPATTHCHHVSMHDMQSSDKAGQSDSQCTHCDSPDMAVSAHAPISSDTVAVLLAVIVLPQVSELESAQRSWSAEVSTSPPDSSSLLYQTTRRILI